jgi:hypothetical protein
VIYFYRKIMDIIRAQEERSDLHEFFHNQVKYKFNAIFIGHIFSLANNICRRIHNYHVVLVWVSCHIEFLISNPLYWLHYALPSKTQFAIINSPIDAQTLEIQYSYFLSNHICKYTKGINIIRIFIFFNLLLNYRFLKLWNITHESLLLQFSSFLIHSIL